MLFVSSSGVWRVPIGALAASTLVLDNAANPLEQEDAQALAQFGGRFVSLPAALLPSGQSHRAGGDRPARQCHLNPPLPHLGPAHGPVHAYLTARSAQHSASPSLHAARRPQSAPPTKKAGPRFTILVLGRRRWLAPTRSVHPGDALEVGPRSGAVGVQPQSRSVRWVGGVGVKTMKWSVMQRRSGSWLRAWPAPDGAAAPSQPSCAATRANPRINRRRMESQEKGFLR